MIVDSHSPCSVNKDPVFFSPRLGFLMQILEVPKILPADLRSPASLQSLPINKPRQQMDVIQVRYERSTIPKENNGSMLTVSSSILKVFKTQTRICPIRTKAISTNDKSEYKLSTFLQLWWRLLLQHWQMFLAQQKSRKNIRNEEKKQMNPSTIKNTTLMQMPCVSSFQNF